MYLTTDKVFPLAYMYLPAATISSSEHLPAATAALTSFFKVWH